MTETVDGSSNAHATGSPAALRILLLDAGGHDRELSEEEFDRDSLSEQRLVWVDMPSGADDRDMTRDRAFLGQLGAPDDTLDALLEAVGRPRLFEYGDIMRLEVTGLTQAVDDSLEESQPVAVLCVVGPNWLVTVHDAPVAFLEEFRERVEGGSDLGDLDAVAFLATLLHWQLTSYDEEIRRIVASLDELEDQALRDSASQQETLEQLVALRRRISRLRALLAPHEPVFAQLARPEFDRLSTSESAEAFRTLADRASASIATVEGAREMLLGAFEILMTRTAQKTNDVVKLLTILTVMLLPSTLIAGVLGMNFHPTFFDTAWLFWVTLGLMITTMTITALTIWRRGWFA
jgi:magnesium transporter